MYITRNKNSILLFNVNHDYFQKCFFPSTIIELSNIDSNVRNSENLAIFKKRMLAFIRPSANSNFHCHSPDNLKLITRLRLRFTRLVLSRLRFRNFKHNFRDILNPICSCGIVEITLNCLLHCRNFSNERLTLFSKP